MKHTYCFFIFFFLVSLATTLKAAVPSISSSLGSQTYWVDEDFNYTITATESPTSFLEGGLVALGGTLSLNSTSGEITGAPSNSGVFELAIAAENLDGQSPVAMIDVVVVPTAITSLSSANGIVGEELSYEITTDSGVAVTYNDSGSLPPGLARVDNIISGTPTLASTYPVTLSASDVNGSGEIVVTFTITDPTDPVPVINSSLQEEILVGNDFNYTITALNSPNFYTGSSASVSGLSAVDTVTGEFSGTPNVPGNYSITLLASNAEGFSSPATLNLVVHPEFITSSSTESAVVESPFIFEITTVNDEGLAFSNDEGLPPGLTRVDNIISGTPTEGGTYPVTISAASLGNYGDQVLTITVTDPAPEITSSLSDQNILAGVPYSYQIEGTYDPNLFDALNLDAVGGLSIDPDGLISGTAGLISGTPVNSGSFPITISASNDDAGFGNPATFNLVVSPTVITSPSLIIGEVGTPFTYNITTAGTSPLAYGVQGSLPPGLSRSGTTISGTPTLAGTYTVTLSASNLDGTGSLSVDFVFTDPAPAIDSSLAAQTILVNEPFTYTITATNNPTVFSAIGLDLIGGLVLDTITGVISGTPLNEGDFVIQIGAENDAGTSPLENLNLVVKGAQYFLEGEVGVPFSHTLTTTLANASIGVSGLGQILGISRDSGTDNISGTPEEFGIYVITVMATDEAGVTDTYNVTVTINKSGGSAPVPVITSSTSITLYEGEGLDYQIQADGNPDSFEVFGLGPLGLTLDSSTGEITGTPTLTGTFNLPIRATNSAGTGSEILELTVVLDTDPIVSIISPVDGFTAQVGVPFEVRVSASDTNGIIESVILKDNDFDRVQIPQVGTAQVGEPGDPDYEPESDNYEPASEGGIVEGTLSFGRDGENTNNDFVEFGDLMRVSSIPGEYVFTATLDEFDEIALVAVARDNSGNRVESQIVRFTVASDGAPTVAITSPTAGGNSPYFLGDTVAIEITASDFDGSVTSVEVYNGTALLGTATRIGNTTFGFNYTANIAGSINLQARVTDNSGSQAVSNIETITVVTGDYPVVAIDELNSVSDGDSITAGGNEEILINATDADGFITQVQIFGNGVLLGQANPTGVAGQFRYNLATDIEDVGIFALEARATDNRGNVAPSSVVNLNVTPGSVPEVIINSPTDGFTTEVGIPIEVRVSASDVDGSIVSVRLIDLNFETEAGTTIDGVFTPGVVVDSSLSFEETEDLMQASALGEYVYDVTLANADVVDLVAVALDNAGNRVTSEPVQFFAYTGNKPTALITSPSAGGNSPYYLGDTIAIKITASDSDGSVTSVDVYNGSAILGTATRTSNTTFQFNYTANSVGSINLQARVTDDSGNTTDSIIETITVETGDVPIVNIDSPVNGGSGPYIIGDTIAIDITAFDSDGSVTTVEVFDGSTLLGTAIQSDSNSFLLNYTSDTLGSFDLQARAVDDEGNACFSAIETITVETGDLPVVAIDEINSVSDGDSITAGGNEEILINATDADGFITQVQIFGNGVLLGQANPTGFAGQFRYNLLTDIEYVGIFALEARATDDRGNVAPSSVVNVDITPGSVPEVSVTAPAVGASQVVGQPFEIRVSALDVDGSIAGVRLTDTRFSREPPTINSNTGVVTPGEVIESTRSFNGELMQPSSIAGEFVYFATIENNDIVDLEATAFDNAGNEVSAVVQFFVTDGTPPTVSIDSPLAGSIVSRGSFAPIEITASDVDGTVQQIEVFNGTISLGFATPLGGLNKYRLDYQANSPGEVYLQARATDDSGNVAISSIETFIVETGDIPVVSITTPISGGTTVAGNSVDILVNAADADGFITQVNIYDGGNLLGEATPNGATSQYRFIFTPDTSNLGTLNLEARVVDNDGNITPSSTVDLIVTRGSIPSVSIMSPNAGDTVPVNIPVEVRVSATDADGDITSVILLDTNFVYSNSVVNTIVGTGVGNNWYFNNETNSSYTTRYRSYYFNVMQPSSVPGEYVFTTSFPNPDIVDLVAIAIDDAGNEVASLPVQFTLAAGALPSATITSPVSGGNSPYIIGETIAIDITAADTDGSVTAVEVYNGAIPLGEATRTSNNSFRLNYTAGTVGTINLQARVTDDSNNTSVSVVETVIVELGDLPQVEILGQVNGILDTETAGDAVAILVSAGMNGGDGFVAQVNIYNGTTFLGQADPTGNPDEYRYILSTDISNIGTLNLEARATDDRGNVVSSTRVNLKVTPGNVPSVSIDSPNDGFTAQVGVPFEVRVSAADTLPGYIASVRLRDIRFDQEAGTTENGVFTPGTVVESTRSFNGNLMQESSVVGQYVFTATITNPDLVDLVAVALDNAGNQVTSVPVQLTATSGIAPTAAITLTSGSSYTLGDSIAIDITVGDTDGSVTAVEVYNGSTSIGAATRTSNTTFRLNYSASSVGLFNLQARVTDDSGNTSVSAVETITVETGNVPTVSITSPTSGDSTIFSLGEIIVLEVTASDSDGSVSQVEVFDGVTSLGLATRIGETSFRLDYNAINVGNLNLQARATDDDGNVGLSNIEAISIDITPPVVSDLQSSLTAVTISQNVELSVRASSANLEISRVIFKAGEKIIGFSSEATTQIGSGEVDLYILNWKPDTEGSFQISVEVEDEFSILTSLSGPTITVTAYDPLSNDENFVTEVFKRLFNQVPTVAQLQEGLSALDGSIESKANYLASILSSNTAENSELAMMTYRTMTGEWPNTEQLQGALTVLSGTLTGITSLSGELTPTQPSQSFQIALSEGDVVTANVSPNSSSGNPLTDPVLAVRAPNGTTIAFNDDYNGLYPQVNFNVEQSGTYTFVVTEFFRRTGAFLLDIENTSTGVNVTDVDALTLSLISEYEERFSVINTKLGFLQQLFFNKHGQAPESQSEIRLFNSLMGESVSLTDDKVIPGYGGNNVSFTTQFAFDNDPSLYTGPNGLPLSNIHLYEMPNDPTSDLKVALVIAAFLGEDPTDQTLAEYSDMSLEQALEDIILEAYTSVPSALGSATSLGSDWYESSWFGMFAYSADSSNWIYSWRLGWVYVADSGTPSGAWLYSSNLGAWLWSSSEINGYYYLSGMPGRDNQWVYMLPEGADSPGAWLKYMDSNQWQFVTP